MTADGAYARPEEPLTSGDESRPIVRAGETIRRPHHSASSFVARYLRHLERAGFERAPRYLGRDEEGRDILSYLEGDVPAGPIEPWAASDEVAADIARLLRNLHDASEGFPVESPFPGAEPDRLLPAAEPRIVTHSDVTPPNTVFRAGRPWGLIDFDLTGVTTRASDLANTAMHWAPLAAPEDRPAALAEADPGERLRLMLDAYGRDHFGAAELLDAAELRFASTLPIMRWRAEHLGGAWARLWKEGIAGEIERRLTWARRERPALEAALGSRGPT